MNPVETIDYKDCKIHIYRDEDACNPRAEFDNFGTMVCFHSRYNLGDKQHSFGSPDEFREWQEQHKDAVVLPLYLYDHSGITMNTTGFSCPWDSGQVGWIYVTAEDVCEEYGETSVTPERRKHVEEMLRCEVAVYDYYLTGEVYGFVIETADDDKLDSCWGFYGGPRDGEHSSWDYMISEAKSAVDCHVNAV